MTKEYTKSWALILGLALMLVSGAAYAQAPADAVAAAIAGSDAFPAGTSVVGVTVSGDSATVELSAEAAPFGLGDEQADAMCKAVADALSDLGITATEVVVAGLPLWQYLPQSTASDGGNVGGSSVGAASVGGDPSGQIGFSSIGGGTGEGSGVPALTGELAGKGVGLYPSHGSYWHQRFGRWFRAMRTFVGPNPVTNSPPLGGAPYQPSDYYYWTKGFQWPMFYEDDHTPNYMRYLRAYCESSGATVLVGRNLDKNAGDFDFNAFGYPNSSFPLPKHQVAAKYHLQEIGAPAAVWNEPALTAQTDKDIRARPYWTNYNMIGKWPLTTAEKNAVRDNPALWQSWVSIHLHSNAAGAGTARGTETYWYTSTYPWLQAKATQFATAFNNALINSIKNEYDGFWAEPMYSNAAGNPPEWPTGTYRGYMHAGPSTPSSSNGWQNRGVKTTNFGEIREAMCPAILTELLFHDDWKFYPDHVFGVDPIFHATVAWGMYEGVCNYFGVAPKPRLAASVDSVSFPTGFVAPGSTVNGTVTMENLGQAWNWGKNWVAMNYGPYTVWKLKATNNDQFAIGTKIEIPSDAPIFPSQTAAFNIALTAPIVSGAYLTEWQMAKDDQRGGEFGPVASAQIQVDADPPVIEIIAPAAADYPYGSTAVSFNVSDALSGVASQSANIDGQAVTSGETVYGLAIGSHTLTVNATDNVGNSSSSSVTFNVVNTVGKTTAGGWIELVNKKATSGFVAEYVEGASAPSGNVTYQDHDIGMTVNSTSLIAMGIVGNHAWILGNCTIEGVPGHWFRIDVIDNGEPGSTDVYNILLDTGYSQGGTLGGGNVTIH